MRIKLFRKRLKKTKTGKIIRRSSHLGHKKAKEAAKVKRRRQRPVLVQKQRKKILKDS